MIFFYALLSLAVTFVFAVTPDGELEARDYSKSEQMNKAFLGDIAADPSSRILNLNSRRGAQWRWPGARIPYIYDANARYNVYELEVIRTAMDNYHRYTCITWEAATLNDRDYVRFINDNGCYSYIGRQGGRQDISLMRPDATGASCMLPAIAQHEMMHCSGFYHEQSRTDRDEYVTIYFQNIISGMASNFDKCSAAECDPLGSLYDYGSVMHYDNTSFSIDPTRYYTIIPKQAGAEIGQRRGFSWIDVFKLNAYYGCPVPMNVPAPIDQNVNPNVCNFDTDFCGWIQDYRVVLNPDVTDPYLQYADSYDFYRISGTTPSANTGPNGDHTSGNGRYIYSEASFPAEQGDTFRIRTPVITGSGAMCVTFWYSMYADDTTLMGTLNVYTLASSDTQRQLRWTRTGAQQTTPTWSQARVDVNINDGFQVLFEVVRGSDYQGDAAIDDFAVTSGACA